MGISLLLLRGQVPRDRDPRQIMFDSLDECDDVWTQLAAAMASGGYGEVWYWGGERTVEYRDGFTERWLPDLGGAGHDFDPDIILARGGFREYDAVLRRHPRAFKVYYGAGRRSVPTVSAGYDLVLVDSPEQLAEAEAKLPGVRSSLFVKPAAENVFRPRPGPKEHDVIFVGNETGPDLKGHGFVLPNLPAGMRMVQVGIASEGLRAAHPRVLFTGWIPRRDIPGLYGRAKAAICCCGEVDSCPRVIPEALACDCPILVLDGVRLWRDRYITPETGLSAPRESFFDRLSWLVENHRSFTPYEYYRRNLSLGVAAEHILRLCGPGAPSGSTDPPCLPGRPAQALGGDRHS